MSSGYKVINTFTAVIFGAYLATVVNYTCKFFITLAHTGGKSTDGYEENYEKIPQSEVYLFFKNYEIYPVLYPTLRCYSFQGILTEREGQVRLTSLHQPTDYSSFAQIKLLEPFKQNEVT